MSPSSKSRNKGSKRIEVQDDLSHNPFAAALAGQLPADSGSAEPSPQDAERPGADRSDAAPDSSADPGYRFAAKVVLRREKKGRGGKTITRIEGIDAPPAGLEALARTLGKALGARAFVEDGQLLISGDQCQSAAKWLSRAGATKVILGN